MSKIKNLKLDIVRALKEVNVEGLEIFKTSESPKVLIEANTFKPPIITYKVISDNADYAFNKTIMKQKAIFEINIWSRNKNDISKILIKLKEVMLKHGIYCRGGNDAEDTENLYRYILHVEIKR